MSIPFENSINPKLSVNGSFYTNKEEIINSSSYYETLYRVRNDYYFSTYKGKKDIRILEKLIEMVAFVEMKYGDKELNKDIFNERFFPELF